MEVVKTVKILLRRKNTPKNKELYVKNAIMIDVVAQSFAHVFLGVNFKDAELFDPFRDRTNTRYKLFEYQPDEG